MKKNNFVLILNWIFVFFCFSCLLAYGIRLGSTLIFIIGILSMPIKPICNIWKRIFNGTLIHFRTIILIIAFIFLVMKLPSSNTIDNLTLDIPKPSHTITNLLNSEHHDSSDINIEHRDSYSEQINSVEKLSIVEDLSTENIFHEEQGTYSGDSNNELSSIPALSIPPVSISDIPAYTDSPYVIINDNIPYFADSKLSALSFELYSELDSFGRCGVVYSCIGKDIMPTEERGAIGHIRPSGWHTIKYDIIADRYLYNRCHLIGYQLTGENDNEKNLITGTRYMNVEGMLPFENMIADYIYETSNHVLYRVTPLFDGNNLLASGVLLEAKSVEDDGNGVCFNVFCYNVQPGIWINYADGSSSIIEYTPQYPDHATGTSASEDIQSSSHETSYVLNKNTKKFHYPSCSSTDDIKELNREDYSGSREELIKNRYIPCKRCNP